MQGQDVALLLKLAILNEPQVPSKNLAESLFISPSEVSKALKRCADSGLLYVSSGEKRVNRTALMEFLTHGLKYVFPPAKGISRSRNPHGRRGGTAQIAPTEGW